MSLHTKTFYWLFPPVPVVVNSQEAKTMLDLVVWMMQHNNQSPLKRWSQIDKYDKVLLWGHWSVDSLFLQMGTHIRFLFVVVPDFIVLFGECGSSADIWWMFNCTKWLKIHFTTASGEQQLGPVWTESAAIWLLKWDVETRESIAQRVYHGC